jgi:hypothetical protein
LILDVQLRGVPHRDRGHLFLIRLEVQVGSISSRLILTRLEVLLGLNISLLLIRLDVQLGSINSRVILTRLEVLLGLSISLLLIRLEVQLGSISSRLILTRLEVQAMCSTRSTTT